MTNQEIIRLYTEEHLTMRQIAELAKCSHVTIHKRLHELGVCAQDGEWTTRECAFCGNLLKVPRCRARENRRSFCNEACKAAAQENPGFNPWRDGQRLARAIVSQYIRLEPDWIVIHKDGDYRNHDKINLLVCPMNDKKKVIWDGAKI